MSRGYWVRGREVVHLEIVGEVCRQEAGRLRGGLVWTVHLGSVSSSLPVGRSICESVWGRSHFSATELGGQRPRCLAPPNAPF